MVFKSMRSLLLAISVFGAGVVAGQFTWVEPSVNADGAVPLSNPFTPQMRIGANLYLQTSAEYRAACLQTYRCASDRLDQLLDASEITGGKPAVIMDLDETVLDNSAFQTYLYRTSQDYTDVLWANYEQNFSKDVTLIPGAKEFISHATAKGVNVVFLSNRLDVYQSSTVAALERLGVAGEKVEDRLYLKKDRDAPSDKSARRDRIGAKYSVLMVIGDNLRDFAEVFVNSKLSAAPTAEEVLNAMTQRKQDVDRAAIHWGQNWFILPNPVYGEWDRLIKVDPIPLMHPTSMPVE